MSIVNVKDLGVRGDGATLETAAIQKVINEAKDGDTVLLSPACASFDAFPKFEVRGNTFKEIIKNL